jgi:hypothetical protein
VCSVASKFREHPCKEQTAAERIGHERPATLNVSPAALEGRPMNAVISVTPPRKGEKGENCRSPLFFPGFRLFACFGTGAEQGVIPGMAAVALAAMRAYRARFLPSCHGRLAAVASRPPRTRRTHTGGCPPSL